MSYDTHYCQLELGVSSQINNYVEKTLAFVIFQLQLTGTYVQSQARMLKYNFDYYYFFYS